MTRQTETISVISEDGHPDHPNELLMTMDGTKPTCPITFWVNGKPVFSMGDFEVEDFKKVLDELTP